ncbi:MAG: hypothetical protein ABSE73_11905 [Planctomycetota bacterium]
MKFGHAFFPAQQLCRALWTSVVCGAVILALAAPVRALIKVEWTVAETYRTSALVLVGSVVSVSAETRVIEVNIQEALKGKSPGERIRVQIVAPVELLKTVVPAQPVVFFLGESDGAIHLADTWLLAAGVPNSGMKVWRVVKVHDTVKQGFPGSTAALVRLVNDLKAGKFTILNKWDGKLFAGGVHKRAQLNLQKPRWIMAADIAGDNKSALLAGTAAGVRLLLPAGDGYEDATEQWGLGTAGVPAGTEAGATKGGYHACGDIDGAGKLDLLLDDTLWLNQGPGKKFVAAKARLEPPVKGRSLAAALAGVTGDRKPDALFLSDAGELRIFENPGSPDKPWPLRLTKSLWDEAEAAEKVFAAFGDWGDNGKLHVLVVSQTGIVRYALDPGGGPPADFLRLTGLDWRKNEKYRNGLKNLHAAALHIGESPAAPGDKTPRGLDLFAVCDAGPLLLLNRGFGTFLLDDNPGGGSAGAPVFGPGTLGALKLTPGTLWAPAGLHGRGVEALLVLAEDGTLYELDGQH